ncbi:exonuclease/endonuclease/phosphatase family protein [Mucilaginibacter paludis]|uniref:Endonuclease/exonuclease/phosphatase n=1 Tax=Mucilaginibacter paludis DSM 18603 TaxID=714943 RepID=H1YEL4_9SPHI|nr:endonuclease/exonuclease/phosphatase [Mucilaginibacter paludis]EHQ30774.1 Endonuclease/exonuclease/phosphatase [Mucilaginibacter paludis DSM 18603]
MKLLHSILTGLSLIFLLGDCSKSSTNSSSVTAAKSATNTTPLPNTVYKTDTLKVMAYNVLNFGDGCQGNIADLDNYFKTIIQYTQPDLLSCEKMNAFSLSATGALNYAAEITDNVLNATFAGRYAYATPTNFSNDNKMSVLFYNRQKLSFVNETTIVKNVSDFNLYKLYYNDPNLGITHDTTFLYVLVNHTQSGNSPNAIRDQQETQEMQALRSKFAYLPNLINMGDFNQHNSIEAGYQAIISAADTGTQMSDPPFGVDKVLQYPADWDNDPASFKPYLTTSTRLSASIPNTCGTSGGAKSWYDHILISPWLVKGANYIQYIPNSYQTVGNDGQRLGVDVNSTTPVTNTSTPANVINALFNFSNKYPITIRLLVKANRTGGSLNDPAEKN